ncbi:hypothetical protein FB479_101117 [Brevibacillus sp. AG162]|nr:hypothetical protein FB479_101117 [Brevibacillus sp. AG162]
MREYSVKGTVVKDGGKWYIKDVQKVKKSKSLSNSKADKKVT